MIAPQPNCYPCHGTGETAGRPCGCVECDECGALATVVRWDGEKKFCAECDPEHPERVASS